MEEFFGFSFSNNLHSFFLLPQLEGKQAASAPTGGELKFLRHQEEEETSTLRESFFGTQREREREEDRSTWGKASSVDSKRRRRRVQLEGKLPHREEEEVEEEKEKESST